ncbi:hypothetical protein MGYG_03003 [Nannizzia gypsea CBS 118893]|uniref:GPI transamidase component PIG-S n=1 Tax=Arthroderma gypseum (strain ATCC MYA-4604 / CBS 118893) TaxID=535722 RepID=E4UQ76_ARTGP|nr:hypothetical protein MGYG_03003 [Nannizzia gypsea CBS 118893]EFQ99995.1 hypothetical protein MGYG_03003 [Nannizzia gypsea CBS 118893]
MVKSKSHFVTLYLSFFYCYGTASSLKLGSVPGLLPREQICAKAGFKQCGNPNVPKNFCCSENSDCLVIDNASTVICCPKGADCKTIRPITCDVQLQNVAVDPGSSIKTTKLTGDLPKCGSMCCPHGYACQDQSCVLVNTSSEPVRSPEPAPSASISISPTTAPSFTSKPTSTADPATSPTAEQCSKFPPGAIAVGFVPGIVCGIIISVIFTCLRRKSAEKPQSLHPDAGHYRQKSVDGTVISISDPMPSSAQDSFRTDFLRQQASYHGSNKFDNRRSRIQRTSDRVKSLFAPKFSVITDPPPSEVPPMPVTPQNKAFPQRASSTESIKVYSPVYLGDENRLKPSIGLTASGRPPTTFTEMMERVGFQNGRGSPCYHVSNTPPPPISKTSTGSPLKQI